MPSSGLRALSPEPRPGPRVWSLPPSQVSGCSDRRMEESAQSRFRNRARARPKASAFVPGRRGCVGLGEHGGSLPGQAQAESAGPQATSGRAHGQAEPRAPAKGWGWGWCPASRDRVSALNWGLVAPRQGPETKGCHVPLAGEQANRANGGQDTENQCLLSVLRVTTHTLGVPLLGAPVGCCMPTASFLPGVSHLSRSTTTTPR